MQAEYSSGNAFAPSVSTQRGDVWDGPPLLVRLRYLTLHGSEEGRPLSRFEGESAAQAILAVADSDDRVRKRDLDAGR